MILELQNLMLRGLQDWKLQCNKDLSTGNKDFFYKFEYFCFN
jgi:hypothetical protein